MKNLILPAIIALMMLGLYSCDEEEINNPTFERLEIVDAELPDTFLLGRTYEIRVTYNRPDGCTYLQDFNVIPADQTTREIQAVGVRYDQDMCTQVITEETNEFLFQVIYDQPYTFKFWKGENSDGEPQFMTIDVPVR